MKITKGQLRQVIREELERHLLEQGDVSDLVKKFDAAVSVWDQLSGSVRAMVGGNIERALGYASQGATNDAASHLDAALERAASRGISPGGPDSVETARAAWESSDKPSLP